MKNKSSFKRVLLSAMVFFGLAFIAFSADYMNRKIKEMDNAKPFYLKRTGAQWEKQGRIIGELKNTPKTFSIDICLPGSKPLKVLKTEIFDTNLSVYETGWIGFGTYDIVYKAEGYIDHTVKNVSIKPYSDCVVNIVFGLTEYKR